MAFIGSFWYFAFHTKFSVHSFIFLTKWCTLKFRENCFWEFIFCQQCNPENGENNFVVRNENYLLFVLDHFFSFSPLQLWGKLVLSDVEKCTCQKGFTVSCIQSCLPFQNVFQFFFWPYCRFTALKLKKVNLNF